MDNYPAKESYGLVAGAADGRIQVSNYNPTVRENIDGKIKSLRTELERLEKAKIDLEKTQLLDLHISDLRNVMNY